jgi:serine/threonine protein kinase
MLASRGRGKPRVKTEKANPLSLVQTEVAIFKKLNHANVVKLYEVLDAPNGDSIYMVFECCENGVVLDLGAGEDCIPYSEPEARRLFQQIILGIEYCIVFFLIF